MSIIEMETLLLLASGEKTVTYLAVLTLVHYPDKHQVSRHQHQQHHFVNLYTSIHIASLPYPVGITVTENSIQILPHEDQ